MKYLPTKLILISIAVLTASTAQATNGIFVTLESGIATQTGLPAPDTVNASSLATSLTPLALRGGVGYNHDITSYLGLGMNVGLGQYGNSTYLYDNGDTTTIKSEALEFLALITTHIQQVDIIGKIGGVRQESRVTGTNAPDKSDHHNNPEAGIEIAYNFSPKFAATATYAHVFGGTPDEISNIPKDSVSINEFLFGLRYTFASS
jgi:hypothetical protein